MTKALTRKFVRRGKALLSSGCKSHPVSISVKNASGVRISAIVDARFGAIADAVSA